jgi:tetratricopeptide (TPR) repeat protein
MAGRQDIFQESMNKGHSAAWDQQWETAVKYYRQAVDEFPNNHGVLSSLGMAYFEMKNFEEALKIYQKAGQISPEDPLTSEKIAQVCERLGKIPECIQSSLKAADLFLKSRDTEKAVNNWMRILRLDPDHLGTHSRLAMIYERSGRKTDAVNEYLAMAAIMQQSGVVEKAAQVVEYALKLQPGNSKAEEALDLLRKGKDLPKPIRPRGGTAPIMMGKVPGHEAAEKQPTIPERIEVKDPINEAKQRAMVKLADILFEQAEESVTGPVARRGLQAIMRGTGSLALEQAERNKVMMHLGQAIDAQTNGNDAAAAEELEKAIETGLDHTAAYFDLGLLRFQNDKLDVASRYLQHAIKHPDFAFAAQLILGIIDKKANHPVEAGVHFLEALKVADSRLAPEDQADEMRQLYEPFIEEQSKSTDLVASLALCNNIETQLNSPQWRENLQHAREQLPEQMEGSQPLPIAEVFLELRSNQIISVLANVKRMQAQGFNRSAMEEAYFALQSAPTYLPLHIQMADILVQEGLVHEAIDKYIAVANTFSSNGEFTQTTRLLRKVVALDPMDLTARSRLIDQLISQGSIKEAIAEYIELAEIYSHLAELDMARKTLNIALRYSQQSNLYKTETIDILYRMADIDLQRLDWRQAMRIFEQVRTIDPSDGKTRFNLIDLNLRLGQDSTGLAELDSYIAYLESIKEQEKIIPFLEDLIKEHPDYLEFHQRLAELYRMAGKIPEAVIEFDRVSDLFLEAGNKTATIAIVQIIISLRPANVADYKAILEQLQGDSQPL